MQRFKLACMHVCLALTVSCNLACVCVCVCMCVCVCHTHRHTCVLILMTSLVHDDNPRSPLARKVHCHSAANARVTTRDQRDLVLELTRTL